VPPTSAAAFGIWEFAFCAVITLLAYRGLENYRAIALGWVLHTCWDAAHHLYGSPIIPFAPLSYADDDDPRMN